MSSGNQGGHFFLGVFLAAGLALCGYFVGQTMYNAKVALNTAEAKGLAERRVRADRANWDIMHTVKGSKKEEIPSLYNLAEMHQKAIINLLKEHGFDFGGYLSLEKGIFVDKKHFQNNILRLISTTYDSLNYHSSNFEPYIMYLLPHIENSVAEKRISLGREHPTAIGEMLEKANLNKRQYKALSYIIENDRITNREYIKLNGIQSRKLAWEELNQMVSNEILHTFGKGRSVFYTLSNVVTKKAIRIHLGNN